MSEEDVQMRKRAKRWSRDEIGVLMHAAHERREILHGKHRSHSGTQEDKRQAWQEVAEAVNGVFFNLRDAKQCEDKVRCFASEIKQKYCELRQKYGRSGAGGRDKIQDELTETEWLALDYIGVVSVDGLTTIKPTSIPSIVLSNPRPVEGTLRYTRPNIDQQIPETDGETSSDAELQSDTDNTGRTSLSISSTLVPAANRSRKIQKPRTQTQVIADNFLGGASNYPDPMPRSTKPKRVLTSKKTPKPKTTPIAKKKPKKRLLPQVIERLTRLEGTVDRVLTLLIQLPEKLGISKESSGLRQEELAKLPPPPEPTILEIIKQEIKGIIEDMTEDDWAEALKAAKMRNRGFPLYERRACKIFLLVEEDQDAEVLEYANQFVTDYVKANLTESEVTAYTTNRLSTYIVSKLVEYNRVHVPSTPEEDDSLASASFKELLQETSWLEKPKHSTPQKKNKAGTVSNEVESGASVTETSSNCPKSIMVRGTPSMEKTTTGTPITDINVPIGPDQTNFKPPDDLPDLTKMVKSIPAKDGPLAHENGKIQASVVGASTAEKCSTEDDNGHSDGLTDQVVHQSPEPSRPNKRKRDIIDDKENLQVIGPQRAHVEEDDNCHKDDPNKPLPRATGQRGKGKAVAKVANNRRTRRK